MLTVVPEEPEYSPCHIRKALQMHSQWKRDFFGSQRKFFSSAYGFFGSRFSFFGSFLTSLSSW